MPIKRKSATTEESQSPVSLTPRKKPRTDIPANDSASKKSLRPLTSVETNPIRTSPRKTMQPPSALARRETPKKKSSTTIRQKDGVVQGKREGGVDAIKQLHINKVISKTKVLQKIYENPVSFEILHVTAIWR